ncbi:hypothetical protein Nepgr_027000 [Nepenthes gracilis]|uniref:RNA-binding protein AU-1/Ribonuclease E/G domain-containing protein n=1 Tax=Nepenthes gracilis TaxID=150966 RepID=A0AAD3TB00_NEPGR|nr:hypothetical protein Nepgr_027000 [Nepenthes gracilis]
MLCIVNCKCNYYIHGDLWTSRETIWRLKSESALMIPDPGKQYGRIMARLHAKRLATHLRQSSVEEQSLPVQPFISALRIDREENVKCCCSDSSLSEPLLDDLLIENEYYFRTEDTFSVLNENKYFTERYQPVEEPWLLLPPLLSHFASEDTNASHNSTDRDGTLEVLQSDSLDSKPLLNTHGFNADSYFKSEKMYCEHDTGSKPDKSIPERYQPVEEPWLPFPSVDSQKTDMNSTCDASAVKEPVQDEQTLQGYQEQCNQVSKKPQSEGESSLVTQEASISTEILINSSICSMQRIAVLEDGKLVELLLEPVKNNVQCDSVYLGVVTKLVPHMGGAFVNICNSRPSLMEIKNTREPFTFPPFGFSTKGNGEDGASLSMLKEQSSANQNWHVVSDDVEGFNDDPEVDFQNGPALYMHDDFDDHDIEVDIDDEEVKARKLIGTMVSNDGTELTEVDLEESINHSDINISYMKGESDHLPSQVREFEDCKDVSSVEQIWARVRKGTKIIVQVVKEGLGSKGPTLTAYPKLRSRFWILVTRCNKIGVSKKICGVERTRLRVIAKTLQPLGFGLTVRTVAEGHSLEELRMDLEGLLSTWRSIVEHGKSAALAADEGVEGAVPIILHQAMGQTLSVVQDYFSDKVKRMIVDSQRTYHEVTSYLQEIAPDLCDRVELHSKKVALFDEFNIEHEINNILNKRVALPNGGSLVIEQTEALVSIDVNGGHKMFGQGTSQEKAVLDVNLAAAKQIARELRLRDIGGIIVVDFIDMVDDSNKRLVYEEVKKAVEKDRSMVKVSELSKHGLMEITRKRVRPSVTFMISEPCSCCHATGRVEALETSFSKIENEICRLLATMDQRADPVNPKSWPRLILRVDCYMCDFLTSGKKTRLATLSSSLKVWILLKVARSFPRGAFEVKLFSEERGNNDRHRVGVSTAQPAGAPTHPPGSNRTKLFPIKKWRTRGK